MLRLWLWLWLLLLNRLRLRLRLRLALLRNLHRQRRLPLPMPRDLRRHLLLVGVTKSHKQRRKFTGRRDDPLAQKSSSRDGLAHSIWCALRVRRVFARLVYQVWWWGQRPQLTASTRSDGRTFTGQRTVTSQTTHGIEYAVFGE